MLSDKKAIMEIHKLSAQYSQRLKRYRDFFGSFNEIQQAQYTIISKIEKAKKITQVTSILQHSKYEMNNQIISNSDLLKKDHEDFRLLLVRLWFILVAFPISLPTLMLLSRATRGTFNFLRTDGSVFIEKVNALCQFSNNQKTQSKHKTLSNITSWVNNMYSIAEFRYRFSTQNLRRIPHFDSIKPATHEEKKLKHHSSLNTLSDALISEQHSQKEALPEEATYTKMAFNFVCSVPSSIAACTYGLFSVRRKPDLASRTSLEIAISNCESQDERQIADLEIITEALTKFKQEQGFYNKQMLAAQESIKQSTANNFYSREITDVHVLVEPKNKWECMELLNQYSELMNFYPRFLDTDEVTLENIQSYYAASEAHHAKVLAIAECLIPELSCVLNQARLNNNQLSVNNQLNIK